MKAYELYENINDERPELNVMAQTKGFKSISAALSELHWWEKDLDMVEELLHTMPIR